MVAAPDAGQTVHIAAHSDYAGGAGNARVRLFGRPLDLDTADRRRAYLAALGKSKAAPAIRNARPLRRGTARYFLPAQAGGGGIIPHARACHPRELGFPHWKAKRHGWS